VTEFGGKGVQGTVNRGHIDTSERIFERLTGANIVLLDGRLIGRKNGGQNHQREDEHLEQADARHGGSLWWGWRSWRNYQSGTEMRGSNCLQRERRECKVEEDER
jgi:hypothetical protein